MFCITIPSYSAPRLVLYLSFSVYCKITWSLCIGVVLLQGTLDMVSYIVYKGADGWLAAAGILAACCSRGSSFLGLLSSSSVIPFASFVMPITGGSPFLTNSYSPGSR
jgi:hypothetical protein